jgi:FKBP-type peptidyl-prolyl cis-trans isomerase
MVALILALTSARDNPDFPFVGKERTAQAEPQPRPRPTAFVISASTPGSGAEPVSDARITIHFTATQKDATLADTERRGMAFTFLMDQETVEPFWHEAVRSMRVGGTRTILTPASNVGLALQGDPTLTVTIKLIKVVPL